MAMGAFAVYAEAEHYVYYDGTFTKPQVWAWNETEVLQVPIYYQNKQNLTISMDV